MTKLEEIKTHFRENKKLYVGIAIGAGVTIVGVAAYVLVSNKLQVTAVNVGYKNTIEQNVIQVNMTRSGPKSFVVQCRENQQTYPSLRQASLDLDVNAGELSRHLAGKTSDVKGLHFDKLSEI